MAQVAKWMALYVVEFRVCQRQINTCVAKMGPAVCVLTVTMLVRCIEVG